MARKGAEEADDQPASPAPGGALDPAATTTESSPPTVNLEWGRSAYDEETVARWAASEAFRPGELVRWRAPERGRAPAQRGGTGEWDRRLVVLSSSHVTCGLRLDASGFLLGVLAHYGVEWSHLPPNSMTVLCIFAHLCEAYMGVAPTLEVFTHFYRLYRNAKGAPTTLGGAYFRLRDRMKHNYPDYSLRTTHYKWSCAWFYAELPPACRLTSRGFPLKERSSWDSVLPLSAGQNAQVLQIKNLRDQGLTGLDIVRDYVKHRISPLRRRAHLASECSGPSDPTRDSDKELSEEDIESTLSHLLHLKTMEENAPADRSSVPTSLIGLSPHERAERSRGLHHVPLDLEAKEKAIEEMAESKKNNKSSNKTNKPSLAVLGRCTRLSAALGKAAVSPPPEEDSSVVPGHSELEAEILEATTATVASTENPAQIEEGERAELVQPTNSVIGAKRRSYPCPTGYQRRAKISSLYSVSWTPGSAQPSPASPAQPGENGSLVILAKVAGHALIDQPVHDTPPRQVDPVQPITNGANDLEGTREVKDIEAMCEQIKRGEAASSMLRERAMKLVKDNKILKSRNIMLEQQLTGKEEMICKLNELQESTKMALVAKCTEYDNLIKEIAQLKKRNDELRSNMFRAKDMFEEVFKDL